MYTEECIYTFLKNQGQLFDEPVAETYEEAEEFLEDCMAVVLDSLKEVKQYLDELGARSEERRVGKECLRLCRSRWSPYH